MQYTVQLWNKPTNYSSSLFLHHQRLSLLLAAACRVIHRKIFVAWIGRRRALYRSWREVVDWVEWIWRWVWWLWIDTWHIGGRSFRRSMHSLYSDYLLSACNCIPSSPEFGPPYKVFQTNCQHHKAEYEAHEDDENCRASSDQTTIAFGIAAEKE